MCKSSVGLTQSLFFWNQTRLRQTFFPAYFRQSPLQKHVRKSSRWLWKEKLCYYWHEKARKHMCITHHHDMTLAVKVVLNPNTTKQPTGVKNQYFQIFCISRPLGILLNFTSTGYQLMLWQSFSHPYVCPSISPFLVTG